MVSGFFYNSIPTQTNPVEMAKEAERLEKSGNEKVNAGEMGVRMVWGTWGAALLIGISGHSLIGIGMVFAGAALEATSKQMIVEGRHELEDEHAAESARE